METTRRIEISVELTFSGEIAADRRTEADVIRKLGEALRGELCLAPIDADVTTESVVVKSLDVGGYRWEYHKGRGYVRAGFGEHMRSAEAAERPRPFNIKHW